ncbi:hypothetical protein HDV00_012195, partial [Rhizophlyctis rosea]
EIDTKEKCTECATERQFDLQTEDCEVCGSKSWSMEFEYDSENSIPMVSLVPNHIQDVMVGELVYENITADDVEELMERFESLPKGEKANVIVKNGDLQDLLINMVKEKNILADSRSVRLTKVMFTESKEDGSEIQRHRLSIAKMRYGNVILQKNQDYDHVIKSCEIFHIPFGGQTSMNMLVEYFQTCHGNAASSYNDTSEKWFQNSHLALTKVFQTGIVDDDRIAAVDLFRCYENGARMKKTAWSTYHACDFPEPFSGEIVSGKYHLHFAPMEEQPELFQKIPFANGHYYDEFVRYLMSCGVKITISEQIVSQQTLAPDTFDKMFNVAYKAFPDKIAKDNIRKFIAMLNKRVCPRYKTTYSTDEIDLHHTYLGKGFIRKVGEDVFQGFTYKDGTLAENYVPLYQQIIEMSWISMLEMARCVPVNKWVMIKTDELVYLNGDDVQWKEITYDNKEIPYKHEEITEKKKDRLRLFEERCPSTIYGTSVQSMTKTWKFLDNDMWTEFDVEKIVELGSFAVVGNGETGKSHITKKLVEHLGDAVLLTFSTHVTAIGIDGETLHSGLRYDKSGKCFMQSLKDVTHTHIIIDEAKMLDRDVIRALHWLKKSHPEIHFILIGDPTQLPPVMHRIQGMKYDISMNQLFMELCDCQMFHLTENFRNPELTELYKVVGEPDFPKRVGKETDTKLHIIFDNARHRLLGLKVAKGEGRRMKRKAVNVGDFPIFRNVKLYANETHKGFNFLNKETFTVTSDQGKDGTFALKSDLRNHTITLKPDMIMSKFEYSYARTVYGVQGITIDEPYTIHRWNKLIENDKVVAVGRARKTEYINICPGCEICNAKIVFKNVSENEINKNWQKATLEKKRELCLDIINRILRGKKASDEFSQLYTGLTVSELKTRLHIEEGIPRGFAIDHVKFRALHTENDIDMVNHYTNLQIIPERLNSSKGAKEIKYYQN